MSRDTRETTARFYDRISRAYDLVADSSERAARDAGLRALAVSPGERVLEIGCGTGHALVSLASAAGSSGRILGVDVAPGMLAVARQHLQSAAFDNVSLALADARRLCVRPERFDAVFMSFTLELFGRAMPDVLAEVRRVLRPQGRLAVVAMRDSGKTNAMTGLYSWARRRWPDFIDCRPIDAIGLLRAAGFQVSNSQNMAIWGLPVIAAVAIKTPGSAEGAGS